MESKGATLTIRLDKKTRYALELITKQERETATDIIEAVIQARAKKLDLAGREWLALWDEHEGMRKLLELGCATYRSDSNEKEMRLFAQQHRAYWYVDARCTIPKRAYVEVLWPKMRHYIHAWRNDDNATELMNKDLRAAKLQPPK